VARPSRVREAVSGLIGGHARHDWSIEDLLDGLAAEGHRADFSSVFRALAQLEEGGEVRRVDLGDGKSRFEAAGKHHDHVRCGACGAVAGVPCSLLDRVASRVERQTGYAVSGHRLVFTGLCPGCAAKGASA
jgi:Fur family transcriptional regulator, peroxide stress response regulator